MTSHFSGQGVWQRLLGDCDLDIAEQVVAIILMGATAAGRTGANHVQEIANVSGGFLAGDASPLPLLSGTQKAVTALFQLADEWNMLTVVLFDQCPRVEVG